jgi:hypothetical protein
MFVVAGSAALKVSSCFLRLDMTVIQSRSDSAPFCSTSVSRIREASTNSRSESTIGRLKVRVRSRKRLSRFSPTWAIDSSCRNPRTPLVPFRVWIARNILATRSMSSGSFSSSTRSRSTWSSPSLLSTTNSLMISSMPSMCAPGSEGCAIRNACVRP